MQLRNLNDIKTNFRVKEVYAQNNQFTDILGLGKFKFLNVLLCGDN